MDFHYIGVLVLYVMLPLTSEKLHWSSYVGTSFLITMSFPTM